MECSVCSRQVLPRDNNPHYPLCSKRCRLVDLGRWLGGEYVIPGRPVVDDMLIDESHLREDES